ncbi:uncharacterized protein LOC113791764 [Dermatophagoides pteronyssinus]|uniref:Uncharacterized protein n=2 Tax=Dermatophagoides pteronyssinus TaxID=6956 RepID=A0ABQ8JGZ3_DERPT|nr:uncharacterized protein LOC113791764 [Dermatophagoides pteronyssinus]KAH9421873.1 hypothetical protein DERP_002163 [Dermatophagoides pteronyssinus]
MFKNSRQASKPVSELSTTIESATRREWNELSWEEMSFPATNRLPAEETSENMSTFTQIKTGQIKNRSTSRESMQAKIEETIESLQEELGNDDSEPNPEVQTEWSVERIRSKKLVNGIVAYEAKWEGWDEADNTIEKLEHLDNSLILVKSFENSHFITQNSRHPDVQTVHSYKDKSILHNALLWRKLVHLIEPEEILAIDFATRQLLVSFKNVGEVALVDVNNFIKDKKRASMFIKFIHDHPKEFKAPHIPSLPSIL